MRAYTARDSGQAALAGVGYFEASVVSVYPRSLVSREIEQVRAAIAGDDAAMREIYEREAPRLLRRLACLCGGDAPAQDLLQECFLRAFAGEVSFAGASGAAPWLHGIAINLWRNEVRKQSRRRGLLRRIGNPVQPQAPAAPDARRDHDDLKARLQGALDTLDPKLREAFVLRVIEGLSLAEASALARVSVATLSRRARKAEARIRRLFDEAAKHAGGGER
jgi:RNA polymerase sigma-70 factor (ECF subfamily)